METCSSSDLRLPVRVVSDSCGYKGREDLKEKGLLHGRGKMEVRRSKERSFLMGLRDEVVTLYIRGREARGVINEEREVLVHLMELT